MSSDLLKDPKHFRADARMIAKMISLGVVDEERAKRLLTRAIEFAEQAKSCRGLATIIRALVALARLEQTERLSKQATKLDVTITEIGTGGLSRKQILEREMERLKRLISQCGDSADGPVSP